MHFFRLTIFCTVVLACSALFLGQAGLAATPSFTISATNITLPSSGPSADTQVTFTSLNGYSGRLTLTCHYTGGAIGAKPPTCGGGAAVLYVLTAGKITSAPFPFFPFGKNVPLAQRNALPAWRLPLLGVVAIWMFRRRAGNSVGFLLALAVVISLTVSACGSGNSLAGTYPFTLQAADINTGATATTAMTVTVPSV